jgi:hypothetical protein
MIFLSDGDDQIATHGNFNRMKYKLPRYREKEGAEMDLNDFYSHLREFIRSMHFSILSDEDINAM